MNPSTAAAIFALGCFAARFAIRNQCQARRELALEGMGLLSALSAVLLLVVGQ